MLSGRSLLLFNALVFAFVGVSFLLFPTYASQIVTGDVPATPSGLMDMRATYGGVLLGVGLVFQMLNKEPQTRCAGLLALALILGLMAIGRLIGMMLDGPANTIMYLFLAYEILFVGLALRAFKDLR